MIKIELEEIAGLKTAVKAMRNPMNSWDKSDSYLRTVIDDDGQHEEFVLGQEDLKLTQKLSKAGVEHRTFARMIQVWITVDAPLYWWKEMDRYTVGKSQVSCSTMHKIHAKEFTLDDFSVENISGLDAERAMVSVINALNRTREEFLNESDPVQKKKLWYTLIQLLPSSYNQKRTINMTYEVCMKIWKERHNHKLSEWHTLCDFILKLPHLKEIMNLKDGE